MSYADAQGGFIAFGICFMILAFLVKEVGTKWVDVLFPPAAMGSIVAIIGLELAPLAMNMSGFIDPVQGMSNTTAIIISMFTLIVTILATILGRGFIGIIPILIGVISGYILSFFMGVVDFSAVEAAIQCQCYSYDSPGSIRSICRTSGTPLRNQRHYRPRPYQGSGPASFPVR